MFMLSPNQLFFKLILKSHLFCQDDFLVGSQMGACFNQYSRNNTG